MVKEPMPYSIRKIDLDLLIRMQSILSHSAGYTVSIEDEVQYYNPSQSTDWFAILDAKEFPVGFIRRLQQSPQWSLVEFFVEAHAQNRKAALMNLLVAFKGAYDVHMDAGHRLRFDVSLQDDDMHATIEELGFSLKKQVFYHFEKAAPKNPLPSRLPRTLAKDAEQIAEVLSHLSPVSTVQVSNWIEQERVYSAHQDNRIVAAAHIHCYDSDIEVVRIATSPSYLRQGFAKKLLEGICNEATRLSKQRIFLKVDQERKPALAFYKALGFTEDTARSQIWHSNQI